MSTRDEAREQVLAYISNHGSATLRGIQSWYGSCLKADADALAKMVEAGTLTKETVEVYSILRPPAPRRDDALQAIRESAEGLTGSQIQERFALDWDGVEDILQSLMDDGLIFQDEGRRWVAA